MTRTAPEVWLQTSPKCVAENARAGDCGRKKPQNRRPVVAGPMARQNLLLQKANEDSGAYSTNGYLCKVFPAKPMSWRSHPGLPSPVATEYVHIVVYDNPPRPRRRAVFLLRRCPRASMEWIYTWQHIRRGFHQVDHS